MSHHPRPIPRNGRRYASVVTVPFVSGRETGLSSLQPAKVELYQQLAILASVPANSYMLNLRHVSFIVICRYAVWVVGLIAQLVIFSLHLVVRMCL